MNLKLVLFEIGRCCQAQVWRKGASKTKVSLCGLFLGTFVLLFVCSLSAQAQTATVSWGQTHQVIDGFGASDSMDQPPNWSNYQLNSATADLLFSQTAGIGLSLLRVEVPNDGSCSTVSAACMGDLNNMQYAVARGAKVWATPWGPPASMQSNGNTVCNVGTGDASLMPSEYGAYANYLSTFIASAAAQGINIYALSVQNEPDNCPTYYSGSIWTATNLHDFIKNNLGPTLAANHQTGTMIMMPEPEAWSRLASYADDTFTDPSAAQYVSIAAAHDYGYDAASGYPNAQNLGKRLWETEVSTFTSWDPSMTDALRWAQYINDWMVIANANAWHYWCLINGDNEGLLYTTDGSTFQEGKRYYAVGNYSKFVRPGYYRLDATASPQNGVSVSAYSNNPTGAFAIVVINQNGSNLSQTFSLSGFSTTSVTPWITSPSLNLAQQSAVAVSNLSFSYTLPAYSVTTFVGVNVTVAPPTGLTLKVVQ